jgi:hypothetical protein
MLPTPPFPFMHHRSLQSVMQKSQNGASRQSPQNSKPQRFLDRLEMKKL